jgi:hypothetical protein
VAPAVNGTDTVLELVTETVPIVGACGTVVAVTLLEAAEGKEVPDRFDPVTVNV